MINDGKIVAVPVVRMTFKPWQGEAIKDAYGGKAVLDFNGEPVFAELAILRTFQAEGWEGVWVDSYRKKFRVGLPGVVDPIILPPERQALFDRIKDRVGAFRGCWDVFLWKGKEVRFIESKRSKRDAIRPTQVAWLDAALAEGLLLEQFLIIEWDIA